MRTFFSLLVALIAATALAQTNEIKLNLISPLDYQVFQRQTATNGKIVVDVVLETSARGALTNLEKLEVRLTGGNDLQYQTWQPLPFDNRVRHFRAEISAPAGGWYQLQVRLIGDGTNVTETNVEHVGVGEIFIVAGQSNAANHGEGKQQAKNPLVVEFGNGNWHPAKDPEAGASGKGGSFMPAFGDAMTARFNVPIGIVAIAEGATSVREWLPKNDLMVAPPDTGRNTILVGSNLWASTGELFNRIISAQQMLGTNGFRAVLWHQGESDCFEPSDRQISPQIYRQYLQRVIESSRASAGWRVPWFVAQASYHPDHPEGSPELRAAQKSLATDGIALAGPNTDELGAEWRQNNGKGIHFNVRGLQKHGELWAQIVGDWLQNESQVETK
jgi:hypothetical protein